MQKPIDVIAEVLRDREWNFELDAEEQSIRAGLTGENGQWRFSITAKEDRKLCFIRSVFPQNCPAARRRACAELLTRINYGLLLGSFEMNCDDGVVAFKTCGPFSDGELDAELVKRLLGCNLTLMDFYFPAIMAVMYSRVSARKAVERVEKPKERRKTRKKSRLPSRFLNN